MKITGDLKITIILRQIPVLSKQLQQGFEAVLEHGGYEGFVQFRMHFALYPTKDVLAQDENFSF